MKNSKIRLAYSLLLLQVLLIYGCNEPLSPETERLGYEYFPLATGDFRVYQTQVINYNLDGTSDTLNYQLMEVVSERSVADDETSYRLDRFRRANETGDWAIDSVWSARINRYQAIVVEHNVPIIKLSFPLAEDRRWDGNAMNARDFDEFKIKNLGLTYLFDTNEYPNSLEMFKEDLLDPLKITNDDYHVEVFSKGVGLIYKLDLNKKYCNPVDCSEPGIIEQGISFEQKLLEIGKVD